MFLDHIFLTARYLYKVPGCLIFLIDKMILNRTQELHYCISFTLGCLVEVHGCTVGMTLLAVAVPHDCLYLVTGTAVVQAIFSTSIHVAQATTPKWSGAAP